MGTRERPIEAGAARGRALTGAVLRELHGRLDRGIGGGDIARAVGISPAQYSRIERGLTGSVSIEQASSMLAIVGLELSVRVYPSGEPLRDAAHAALIGRFRAGLHPMLRLHGGCVPRSRRPARLGCRRGRHRLATGRGGGDEAARSPGARASAGSQAARRQCVEHVIAAARFASQPRLHASKWRHHGGTISRLGAADP